MTWDYNYRDASRALNLGDELLKNPDKVAQDDRLAMLVSVWYWKRYVRPKLKGNNSDKFGVTTMVINSGECKFEKYKKRAQSRWEKYEKVAEALQIKNKAKESGCYN